MSDRTASLPSGNVDIIIVHHGVLPAERFHELGVEAAFVFEGLDVSARTEWREVDTGPYTDPRREMRVTLTSEWKEAD